MERYRSGHNELHSKCSVPPGTVGSNPTLSAITLIENQWLRAVDFLSTSSQPTRLKNERLLFISYLAVTMTGSMS